MLNSFFIVILKILCSDSKNQNIKDELKSCKDEINMSLQNIRNFESCCENISQRIDILKDHLQNKIWEFHEVKENDDKSHADFLYSIITRIGNDITNEQKNLDENIRSLKNEQEASQELLNRIADLEKKISWI